MSLSRGIITMASKVNVECYTWVQNHKSADDRHLGSFVTCNIAPGYYFDQRRRGNNTVIEMPGKDFE